MWGLGLAVLSAHAAARGMPWEAARAEAQTLVARMTAAEKASLMLGTGWSDGVLTKWHYVGNIPPVVRLGVPPLNMMDAAGGFRTYWTELVGTVTCWPSLLSLAASWDPELVRQFAAALGAEFSGKGANAILGPSVNVHRVARNGRNFEYLSGEDPYLGAQLVPAYVQGVQGLTPTSNPNPTPTPTPTPLPLALALALALVGLALTPTLALALALALAPARRGRDCDHEALRAQPAGDS